MDIKKVRKIGFEPFELIISINTCYDRDAFKTMCNRVRDHIAYDTMVKSGGIVVSDMLVELDKIESIFDEDLE